MYMDFYWGNHQSANIYIISLIFSDVYGSHDERFKQTCTGQYRYTGQDQQVCIHSHILMKFVVICE